MTEKKTTQMEMGLNDIKLSQKNLSKNGDYHPKHTKFGWEHANDVCWIGFSAVTKMQFWILRKAF